MRKKNVVSPVKKRLKAVLLAAMSRLRSHAKRVELPNVDESTFRSFFLAELRRRYPAKCETEWKRFDLFVDWPGNRTLIEFKFYLYKGRKGGPSFKNRREFDACKEKLLKHDGDEIVTKWLVLVYQCDPKSGGKHTFEKHYDREGVLIGPHAMDGVLTCRLIEV